MKTSINLTEVETKEGITVYQNQETGLKCFKTFKFGNDFVTCADGKSLFSNVTVHSHIVVCELPNKYDDSPKRYRIYLRKLKMWLVNPEVEPFLNTEDNRAALNFFEVLQIANEYLHIACQSGGVENRVYVFQNKKWIDVPYSDCGTKLPITSFDEVRVGTVKGQNCIILKRNRQMNPFSVYFFDTKDHYLKIPNSPDFQPKYKAGCVVFCSIFERYVVVAVGRGFTPRPDAYYLWRFDKEEYLPALIERREFVKDNLKFLHSYFTEDYVAVLQTTGWIPWDSDRSEAQFSMISTKTWVPVAVEFTYAKQISDFVRPEIIDGKMVFKTPGPKLLEKT